MISIDPYIIEFVNGNWLTLTLFLGVLKAVAKMTPWAGDDTIYALLAGIVDTARRRKSDGQHNQQAKIVS